MLKTYIHWYHRSWKKTHISVRSLLNLSVYPWCMSDKPHKSEFKIARCIYFHSVSSELQNIKNETSKSEEFFGFDKHMICNSWVYKNILKKHEYIMKKRITSKQSYIKL